MKKPVVRSYRSYFWGLFKREIKIPYKIENGKVIFKYPLKKQNQVIVTYEYKEDDKEKKYNFCPTNNKDFKAMYEIIITDLINAGVGSTHLGYLEILYREAKKNREKYNESKTIN